MSGISQKYVLITFALIVLLTFTPTNAKEYVIGVEDVAYYPYFDYTTDKVCFSQALFDRFGQDNKITFTYLPLPIKQFSRWLKEHSIDFKYPDNERWNIGVPDVPKGIQYSDGILQLTAGTVVLAKHRDSPKSHFKSIGIVRGFHPTLWLDEMAQGSIKILEDGSTKVMVKQLLTGIVDGLDLDLVTVRHYATEMGATQHFAIHQNSHSETFYHHLSTINHPEIIDLFDRWLAQNQAFVHSLEKHYGVGRYFSERKLANIEH